jgi:hypothetical protein
LPVEKLAGRQLGLDIPFKDEARDAEGIDKVLAKALNLIGADSLAPVRRTETGEEVQQITDFPSYALGNFLPLIANLQRLAGGKLGGKESYSDRQNAAIATFTGIPIDFVTDRMQGSEAIGRQFDVRDYAGLLSDLGLLRGAADFKKEQSDLSQAEKNRQRRIKSDAAAKAAEAKRRQSAKDKGDLKRAEAKYGKNSPEYAAVKKRIDDRKERERKAELKKEFEKNPIQIGEEE